MVTRLPYIINIMTADGMETRWAKAPAFKVSTKFSWIIPISTSK